MYKWCDLTSGFCYNTLHHIYIVSGLSGQKPLTLPCKTTLSLGESKGQTAAHGPSPVRFMTLRRPWDTSHMLIPQCATEYTTSFVEHSSPSTLNRRLYPWRSGIYQSNYINAMVSIIHRNELTSHIVTVQIMYSWCTVFYCSDKVCQRPYSIFQKREAPSLSWGRKECLITLFHIVWTIIPPLLHHLYSYSIKQRRLP